jgi:hypothetical protein
MGLYSGLLLVAIGIGYLTVRFFQRRTQVVVDKMVKTASPPASNQTHRKKQKASPGSASSGSRGNSAGETTRRSAFVAGSNQKPWGW